MPRTAAQLMVAIGQESLQQVALPFVRLHRSAVPPRPQVLGTSCLAVGPEGQLANSGRQVGFSAEHGVTDIGQPAGRPTPGVGESPRVMAVDGLPAGRGLVVG